MIVLTGISHHTAHIDIREKLALTDEEARVLGARLSAASSITEVFVVSTCNRVEIIASSVGDDAASVEDCAAQCLAALVERAPEVRPAVYSHRGTQAVRHLVRVASSLDSLVVGEAQILGQLKQGFEEARKSARVGATLHELFARVARGAKRVRSETSIGVGQVSVPSIAVELAGQIFGDMKGRQAVLVGAGEMGQTVARLLRDAGAKLTVVGRDATRVEEVCRRIGGTPCDIAGLPEALVHADIVVCSTSATHHVLEVSHLSRRRKARRAANLFVIDLAVPRDVDPKVADLSGVFLYDIDDLSQVASDSATVRKKAAEDAEQIVEDVVRDWEKRQSARLVTPTIKALRAKMRRGLEEELSRSLRGRLKDLDVEQRAALTKMLDAGINRILHEPVTRLRDEAIREERFSGDELAQMLADLFELSEVPEDELDVSSVRLPDSSPRASNAPPSFPGEKPSPGVSYLHKDVEGDPNDHFKVASDKNTSR